MYLFVAKVSIPMIVFARFEETELPSQGVFFSK